ncbi:MAG: hypothetical protein Tsb009_32960 [Planctomycetaceae bacterium]
MPFTIACINRKSGDIHWTAQVRADGNYVFKNGRLLARTYEGVGFHLVDFVFKNGSLFVFGGGDTSLYVEAFSAATGKKTLGFNTSL